MKNYTKIIFFISSTLLIISTAALYFLSTSSISVIFNNEPFFQNIRDDTIVEFIETNYYWFDFGWIISLTLLFINFSFFLAFKLKDLIKK